jgi:hypothetical protein
MEHRPAFVAPDGFPLRGADDVCGCMLLLLRAPVLFCADAETMLRSLAGFFCVLAGIPKKEKTMETEQELMGTNLPYSLPAVPRLRATQMSSPQKRGCRSVHASHIVTALIHPSRSTREWS